MNSLREKGNFFEDSGNTYTEAPPKNLSGVPERINNPSDYQSRCSSRNEKKKLPENISEVSLFGFFPENYSRNSSQSFPKNLSGVCM